VEVVELTAEAASLRGEIEGLEQANSELHAEMGSLRELLSRMESGGPLDLDFEARLAERDRQIESQLREIEASQEKLRSMQALTLEVLAMFAGLSGSDELSGTVRESFELAGFNGADFAFAGAEMAAPPLATGREQLLPGQHEQPGYGLYSYLLILERPTGEAEKARVQAALHALLTSLSDIDELVVGGFAKSQLNALHVPMREQVEWDRAHETDESMKQVVEGLVSSYDYTRATYLASRLDERARGLRGPILIACQRPLSEQANLSRYLLIDLNNKPPGMVKAWSTEFLRRTHKPEFWVDNQNWLLNLRQALADAAVAFGEVTEAVDKLPGFLATMFE